MENTVSLSTTINQLRGEGYTEDFNLQQQCIECRNGQYRIFHDEFVVDKFYRFEGESDPADEAVVYAISSDRYGLKGVLVNGYGIYSEPLTDEMVSKLSVHH
jgi:hypothetical protein